MKSLDWTGFGIYLAFNVVLSAIGIDIIDNTLSWFALNGLLLFNDMHQYRRGIMTGGEIMLEVQRGHGTW